MKTNKFLLAVFTTAFLGLMSSSAQTQVYLGQQAGQSNVAGTTGNYNVGIGERALTSLTSGSRNVAIGKQAMMYNVNSSNNSSFGYYSLYNLTGGGFNVGIGTSAGWSLSSGSCNTFVGPSSGIGLASGNANTFIGNVGWGNLPSLSNTIILADGGTETTTGNQRMIIDSNGFAGIGLGSVLVAGNRLEINSVGAVAGTSGLRFRGYTSTATPVASNGRVLTLTTDGDVVLTTDQGSGGATIINAGNTNVTVNGGGVPTNPYAISAKNIYTDDGTLSANRTVSMNNNSMIFNTADNGRIYIGNTSPAFNATTFPTTTGNYRLYVEGGILTEKAKVALRNPGTNWADYVFANDYKLMPLKEVEAFVKENKHLPGIESADELVKNGLDLGEMQAKQMGKIEELTLHAIEQEKKLEAQAKEIEELKTLVKALLNKK